MRKVLGCAAVVALMLASVAPAFAATETVKGTIVDQSCYLKDKASNAGVDHKMPADVKDCAVACAKKGRPLALLTSDGKVYTIGGGLAADNNAKLVAHVAHTVEITGDVASKDGAMTITASDLKMAK
jgi:hypothetical protein